MQDFKYYYLYHYFISYSYVLNNEIRHGNTIYKTNYKIKEYDDIKYCQEDTEKRKNIKDVVILNFFLLEK